MIPELSASEYIRVVIGSFLIGVAGTVPVYANTNSIESAVLGFIGFFVGALLSAFGIVVPVINAAMYRAVRNSNSVVARAIRRAHEDEE